MFTLENISVLLQALGTLLGASSVVGPERLARWEANIRRYLNVPRLVTVLIEKAKAVEGVSFIILRLPTIIGVGVLAFLLIVGFNIIIQHPYFVNRIHNIFTGTNLPAETYTLLSCGFWMALLIVIVLYLTVLRFMLMLFLIPIILIAEIVGVWVARKLAYVVYIIMLIPILTAYLLTVIMLIPYLLADLISIHFDLRPALVVLGTVLAVVGTLLQLRF
jgi:hypothetical protein